jgi:hypothetical protein
MSTSGSGRGVIIANESVSLSKTYPIIGVFMALLGLLISSLSGTVNNPSKILPGGNLTSTANLDLSKSLPLIAVPLQALAAIIFATPVLLLFVYDKNNGVLEYFLSLGMRQKEDYGRHVSSVM